MSSMTQNPQVPVQGSQEEEKTKIELQSLFIDLLTSAQELSYEMATLEPKENYTKEDLKDLLEAGRKVVSSVKRMHQFLKVYSKR
ncbi:MAG: hypothetical protein RXO54_04080 [Acidilobus sp.]